MARRTIGFLGVASALWSAWVSAFGGFKTEVFGIAIKSTDPLRPLLLSLFLLGVLVFLVGRDQSVAACRSWARSTARRIADGYIAVRRAWRAGSIQDPLAAALVLALLILGIVNGSKAAGGSDSYGYLSQSELWLGRSLSVSQPWVQEVPWPRARESFAPLGYNPSGPPSTLTIAGYRPTHDPWAIVPTYSPGLPMLMAVAKLTGSTCAPFWVVPIGGCLLVLSTYLIGRRIGSKNLGMMAALLMAASPPFLAFHLVSMADVPVAGALTLACWFALGLSLRSAFGAAACLAIALLIRPNMAVVVPAIGVLLVIRLWRDSAHRKRHLWRALAIAGGAGVGVLTIMTIYWFAYGSPLVSGYGRTAQYFDVRHIFPNVRNYTTWFVETHTPIPLIGLAALFIPVRWLWTDVTERWIIPVLGVFTAAVIAEFLYYLVLDNASYLRFLLPGYPFVMLGLSSVVLSVATRFGRAGPPLAVVALMVLALSGVRSAAVNWHAFQSWNGEAKFIDIAEHVQRETPANSVVIAMMHSGNLRYFGGRMTLRWDQLPREWLDRAVAWMAARGVHSYALLEDWELELAKQHFRGQALAATLAGPPVFIFGNMHFFDLARAPEAVVTRQIPVLDRPRRCVAPAPPPVVTWR